MCPGHKIGQGQPKVMMLTNYDGLETLTLHNGPQVQNKILRGFIIHGYGDHHGHATWIIQNFTPPSQ